MFDTDAINRQALDRVQTYHRQATAARSLRTAAAPSGTRHLLARAIRAVANAVDPTRSLPRKEASDG